MGRRAGQSRAGAAACAVVAALAATGAGAARASDLVLAPAPGASPDDRLERELRGLLDGKRDVLARDDGQERLASAERLGVKCAFNDDDCLVKLVVVADVDAILLYDAGTGTTRLALVEASDRVVRRAKGNAARAVAAVLGETPVVEPPPRDPPPRDPPPRDPPPRDPPPRDPPLRDSDPPVVDGPAGPSPLLVVGGIAGGLGAVGLVAAGVGIAASNAVFEDRTQPTDARLTAQTTAWACLAVAGASSFLALGGAAMLALGLVGGE